MSKIRAMRVGSEIHQAVRLERNGWSTTCSCGRMPNAEGSASSVANQWKSHVEEQASTLGIDPEVFIPPPVDVLAECTSCGWQGRRKAPNAGYGGQLGRCRRCRATVYRIGVGQRKEANRLRREWAADTADAILAAIGLEVESEAPTDR